MKKVIILLLIGASFTVCAQETNTEVSKSEYNKWSIELAGGIHKPTRSFSPGYFVNTPSFGQASLGARYMFNNKFGVKFEGGFASVKSDENSLDFKTTNYRASLQGVINLGNVLNFQDWTENFGLLIHGGGGYSFNSFDEDVVGPNFGNDQILHVMAGITPQVKLSNSIVLTLDVAAIGNARQTRAWDGASQPTVRGFDGLVLNASAGLTFYLGKNDKHADWVGDDNTLEDKIAELEERLAKVETDLIDTDQDGVPDYLDREPNTISGVAVNTKGIAVDKNKNGVPDELESTLDKRYLNINDYKPTTTVNGGNVIKDLINDGYVNVYFKFNSTTPQEYSLEAINYLKVYLKDNPSVTAELIGYADEIGNATYNNTLSERRAKKVYDVIVASGVNSNRLSHKGGGEDTSVDKNSAQARQLVRRVTFKLK